MYDVDCSTAVQCVVSSSSGWRWCHHDTGHTHRLFLLMHCHCTSLYVTESYCQQSLNDKTCSAFSVHMKSNLRTEIQLLRSLISWDLIILQISSSLRSQDLSDLKISITLISNSNNTPRIIFFRDV